MPRQNRKQKKVSPFMILNDKNPPKGSKQIQETDRAKEENNENRHMVDHNYFFPKSGFLEELSSSTFNIRQPGQENAFESGEYSTDSLPGH